MAKTHSITVRLTEEQKNFIDEKIAYIKSKVDVDIDIPAGLVIREIIDRTMIFQDLKKSGGNDVEALQLLKEYLCRKYGEGYEKKEGKLEDLLKLIEEYHDAEKYE
ncbi:MAG: hypothetical protein PHC75_01680 [Burkholderiales bacterium]|nr:hypothetical protein [Burkholderiales bacterium]